MGEGVERKACFFSFQMVIGQVKLYCSTELSKSPAFSYLPAAENPEEFLNQVLTFTLLKHYMKVIQTAVSYSCVSVQRDNDC